MTHDWLEDLHRTGDWRQLADWLTRHGEYLAHSMAMFADSMRLQKYQPTPRQLALLISLRGGVEAVLNYEATVDATEPEPAGNDYAEAAMAGDDASAAEGARVLASVLKPARRPASRHTTPRCGARTWAGHPCRNEVEKPGSRCRLHTGRKPHENRQRPSSPPFLH